MNQDEDVHPSLLIDTSLYFKSNAYPTTPTTTSLEEKKLFLHFVEEDNLSGNLYRKQSQFFRIIVVINISIKKPSPKKLSFDM